ncbi:MAG: sugar ABC transporter ATP-binding protein [Lachnospiraceae bacterium]|jgi:ribose transport system ATP-binding protein
MENNVFLSTRGLTKTYGQVTVLRDISMDFYKGEVHALIGENGAGKSTLCKMISGAISPTSGKIIIDDKSHDFFTPEEAKSLGIGIVYQELNLISELTVYENLFVGKEIKKGPFLNKKEMVRQANEVFDGMGISVDVMKPVSELSVAFCQLVEIAKALIENSKLIIFDEPTAPLTNNEVDVLFKIIKRLKEQGIAIIYISHRMDEIFRICDKVTVFRDGEYISTQDIGETTREELIKLMIGRELTREFPERVANIYSDADNILEVRHLSTAKLKDISFELKRGEILGISGLVGSGRSEIVRAIFGVDKVHSGEILLEGKKTKIKHPKDAIKDGFALVPEDRKREGLMLQQSIRLNMTITVLDKLSRAGFINDKKEKKELDRGINLLSVKLASVKNPVTNLSGGNQQKVVLAKWISTGNDVLLFDEPTRGVDVGAKKEIYDFLFELKSQGKSIILISSEMQEILGLCDRILVMCEGRLLGELNAEEATQEKILTLASGITE